jgi:hypothetical protein
VATEAVARAETHLPLIWIKSSAVVAKKHPLVLMAAVQPGHERCRGSKASNSRHPGDHVLPPCGVAGCAAPIKPVFPPPAYWLGVWCRLVGPTQGHCDVPEPITSTRRPAQRRVRYSVRTSSGLVATRQTRGSPPTSTFPATSSQMARFARARSSRV